jgi:hypothetical protein
VLLTQFIPLPLDGFDPFVEEVRLGGSTTVAW